MNELRPVLVVDNGAQNAQLIARRVRGAGYFSELVPPSWSAEQMLEKNQQAIVLSGGSASVQADGAPQLDPALVDAGLPVLDGRWQREAQHSELDQEEIEAFLRENAGLEKNWSATSVIDHQIATIREQVGDKHAIVGLSGGVDSSVAAALVHQAIGDQLTAVFVDHGLLRKGEAEQVVRDYAGARACALWLWMNRRDSLARLTE